MPEITLEVLNQKLDELKSLVIKSPAVPDPTNLAYELPPLPVEQVTVSTKGNRVFNRDGSLWAFDINKVPQRDYFGYYSAAKCPETHEKLLQMFGESYRNWYEIRDPWTIYKVDIRDMVKTGVINWITFSMLMQPAGVLVQ